jgi:putative oxidoreductase
MNSDRLRQLTRVALAALWVTLAVECVYVVYARLSLHSTWNHLLQPLLFVALFGSLAATRGRIRWIATLVRVAIGAEFILSVADRFGLLGPPGSAVSWGDFGHFVTYTRQVNSFLPAGFAPLLAVLASICETTFGITLVLGVFIRYVARATAVLLFLFGSAMIASGLIESQFYYAVFVLAAGALAIANVDASLLSLDALRARFRQRHVAV